MRIMNIKKALKISILMTVILALPIMYTLATESAISYTLSEDKKSAMIHIDVNKVIGNNELVEVKDQDNNLLTEYDKTVTENGTYSYTVTYKEKVIEETVAEESASVAYTQDIIETPKEEINVKSEKLEITVTDIELKEESKLNEDIEPSQPLQSASEEELNVTATSVETDAKYFEFDAATGTITKFKSDVTPAITDVVIPASINGKAVKTIGTDSFSRSSISSVVIPDSVTNIESSAFSQSDSLVSVTISGNIEKIGTNAFWFCRQLTNVKFLGTVKEFVSNVFGSCDSLTNIELPQGLEKMDIDTFNGCDQLESVKFQDGLKKIGINTFRLCISLKEVIIPDSVESIGNSAFSQCTSLKEIKLPSHLNFMDSNAFDRCSSLESIIIPEGVTSIGRGAFSGCTSLKTAVLPNSLVDIKESAFRTCSSLTEITIPDGIQSIPEYTFTNCSSLKKVKLSSQITSIGIAAFAGCESLSEMIFPDTITHISDYAFQQCINLSSINLPASIELVGEEAFEGCALPSANFEKPENNPSVTVNAFINQKAIIRIYHTSEGDFVNFNEYTPFATKITLTGNDFTMLDNGIAKANIKNPSNIIYSYPVLGVFDLIKFSANSTFHTFYAYKAQFICEENIVEEKYVLEDKELVFPAIPEKEGYTGFWNKKDKVIQRDEVFHVIYKIKPYLEGSNKIEIDQSSLFDPNRTFIFKDADGNIINDAKFTGAVNTKKPGEYILEYEATDQWGGKTKGECFVTVKAKEGNKDEIVFPGEDGIPGTDDDIIVKPGTIDDKGNVIIPDGGTIVYPDGSHEDFPNGGIILPGEDGEIGADDDIIVKPGTIDNNGNVIIPDGGTIVYPDGSHDDFPNGGIILPGEDEELGTKDDIIVKPGTIDNNGNVIIPDGGTIIYPDGSHDDFPNGGIILPGEDEELGTKDDIIVKPGTIDNNGNVIIPDGGTIIYPDGSHEDFPNGGIILPGEDDELGTKDDIIVKPGTIDNNGNVIIPDGGTIIYPDGSHKDFPDGGIVLPGEDGKSGTKDDVIVKDGNIDDKGNIIISAGGEILYPDGRIEKLPNGGILYAGLDGIFGTKDDQLIKNRNQESIDISKENQLFKNVITGDNTYLLLWSLVGLISLVNIMILMKRKKLGSENR